MIKCLCCKRDTKVEFKNIQKKHVERMVAIKNIPGHHCLKCKKTFYTHETVNVLKFVTSKYFTDKRILLLYDTVLQQYQDNLKLLGYEVDEEKEKELSKVDIFKEKNDEEKKSDRLNNLSNLLELGNLLEIEKNKNSNKISVEAEEQEDAKLTYSGPYYRGCKAAENLMSLKIERNQVVMVYHHSGIKPFRSVVLDSNGNICLVKIAKDFALMNFLEGDPTVLKFSQDEIVYVIGCTVTNINIRDMTAVLNIDKIRVCENQRRSERIPVSLYAEIRKPWNSERYIGVVKNLSLHGVLIRTKHDIGEGSGYEIDLHTSERIIYVRATIVRTQQVENYNEYGVEFSGADEDTREILKRFIQSL